jgi:hypothetical protein
LSNIKPAISKLETNIERIATISLFLNIKSLLGLNLEIKEIANIKLPLVITNNSTLIAFLSKIKVFIVVLVNTEKTYSTTVLITIIKTKGINEVKTVLKKDPFKKNRP